MKTSRRGNPVVKVLLYLLFIFLCILILVPLFAIALASLKPGSELFRYGLNLKLDFEIMSLNNYTQLFTDSQFLRWFGNSVVLTGLQTALTLLISSMVGYGLGAYDFKGKNAIFFCVLLLLMVPLEVIMLPMYRLVIGIGLQNNILGVVFPFMAGASTIFFFRQYVLGIPRAIIDSGRVDGANEFKIYFQLIVPIMKPAIASMAILTGMNSWNSFLWPLLVYNSSEKFTLPLGLKTLLTPYGNKYDLLVAGAVISIVPVLILFLCFQQYFVAGMTAGSVKE